MDDVNSLTDAMKDYYGVFGVTSFWEHFNKEFDQGKNLADAVSKSNISHFIFSTLPGAKKISNGKYIAPHLDLKSDLEDYSKSLDLNATYLHAAFYYENFLSFFPPQKAEEGSYSFGFPQSNNLRAISWKISEVLFCRYSSIRENLLAGEYLQQVTLLHRLNMQL